MNKNKYDKAVTKEITTTNIYADDKVTKTITEYKYNEEVE